MSQKTVIILYNGEETKMEFNLEEINTYDLLMSKIQSTINENNPSLHYNLMAINSLEPYTLIEQDNYMKIMKEQINEGDLKIFFNKIDMNEIDNIGNENNSTDPPPASNKIFEVEANNEDDDNEFVIENGDDENKENNKNENINKNEDIKKEISKEEDEKQLKINETLNKIDSTDENEIINNDNYEDEDDNNNIYNETNIMLEKINKVMGQSNMFMYKHSKSVDISKNITNNNNNNIINNNFNFNDNDDNFNHSLEKDNNKENNIIINNNKINEKEKPELNLIKPDTFISVKCSICKDTLLGIKYICCVCENITLCTNCELEHFHPCIKFKTPFLSNLEEIYKFISISYNFKVPTNNFFSKIFKKEYEISFIPLTDKKICLRPEKEMLLPIKIVNLSKEIIKSSQLEIIPKDNTLVQIYNENKFVLGPNTSKIVKMKCITGSNLGKENIIFYGFSQDLIFKNPEKVKFSLDFEVNNDEEEEKLNKKLEYNENVIMYNKEHKKLALEILESIYDDNRTNGHLNKVFNILIENDWDKNKSINYIKALKK